MPELRAIVVAFALIFMACATAYQPQGFTGGYSEIQVAEDVFQVTFHGNGYTGRGRAADFNLLRCAELALNHGYTCFIIVEADQYTTRSTYTTPRKTKTTGTVNSYGGYATVNTKTVTTGGETYNISKPSAVNTIVCFKEKPADVLVAYDAALVSQQIRNKYGIK